MRSWRWQYKLGVSDAVEQRCQSDLAKSDVLRVRKASKIWNKLVCAICSTLRLPHGDGSYSLKELTANWIFVDSRSKKL